MKKYRIIGTIALVAVMSGTMVLAAPKDKEAKAVERDAKKSERQTALDEKKAERDVKIADKKAAVEEKKVAKACERVQKAVARLEAKTMKNEDQALGKIESRLAQVKEKRTAQNKDLLARRQMRDQQRMNFYQQISTKAQTDEQIAAIATFKEIVEAAVVTRREAIDAATIAMQNAIDGLAIKKNESVEKAYNEYKASYETAIANAGGTCPEDATTEDLKNIAKDLNAELKTARSKFRADIKNTRQVGPEAQELAAIRKTAVKDVIAKFKATVDPAREALITAFGGSIMTDDAEDTEDDMDEKENEDMDEEVNEDMDEKENKEEQNESEEEGTEQSTETATNTQE